MPPVIDSYANTEGILTRQKQKLLDDFNEQLNDFFTYFLANGQLYGASAIQTEHRLQAETAVVDCLKPTVEEIRGLPNFQKMTRICEGDGCQLTIIPCNMPLQNEGLVYYNFYVYINRPAS